MAFNFIVRSDVWTDVESAVDWYNHEIKGLGQRFFQSFEQATTQIITNPFHIYVYHKECQKMPR